MAGLNGGVQLYLASCKGSGDHWIIDGLTAEHISGIVLAGNVFKPDAAVEPCEHRTRL